MNAILFAVSKTKLTKAVVALTFSVLFASTFTGQTASADIDCEEILNTTHEEFIGIPDTAVGPLIDPVKGYLVEEINDGLYWVTDGFYNAMFIVTIHGVIAVDAPPTIGANYITAIKEITDKPVEYLVYSHSHIDHIGSAKLFVDEYPDVKIVAQKQVADHLEEKNDPDRPIPDITFVNQRIMPLDNGNKLELYYKQDNLHQPGNIYIYAPSHKVLMLVDVIFPGWVPFKNLALAEDVNQYLSAPDIIQEFDYDVFIGGHVNRLGIPQDIDTHKEYFDDIQYNASLANQCVNFEDIASQRGFNDLWDLFDTYMDKVTDVCTELTLVKWADKLGGAQTFTEDHCFVITEHQRID